MQKFTFTVRGMGLEQGYVCIDCVKSILKHLSDDSDVLSVTFSNIKKEFTLSAGTDSARHIKNILKKAAKKAGDSLNKDFIPDNVRPA